MTRKRRSKMIIPGGTTLCPQCEGVGCAMCGGKGYYDAHLDKQTPVKSPKPTRSCNNCGAMAWWWREPRVILGSYSPGGWLCGICHPDPKQ